MFRYDGISPPFTNMVKMRMMLKKLRSGNFFSGQHIGCHHRQDIAQYCADYHIQHGVKIAGGNIGVFPAPRYRPLFESRAATAENRCAASAGWERDSEAISTYIMGYRQINATANRNIRLQTSNILAPRLCLCLFIKSLHLYAFSKFGFACGVTKSYQSVVSFTLPVM